MVTKAREEIMNRESDEAFKHAEQKQAKKIRDAQKIKEARDQANSSWIAAEQYASEIETYLNSLKSSFSVFILMDLHIICSRARQNADKAKAASESAHRVGSITQVRKYAKEAKIAERIAYDAKLKMQYDKIKFDKRKSDIRTDYCYKEQTEEELFEQDAFRWAKDKNFEQVVSGINKFINTDEVCNILSALEKHKNVTRAYRELSRLFHPDVLHKHKDLPEIEKFKYGIIMKLLNAAKAST